MWEILSGKKKLSLNFSGCAFCFETQDMEEGHMMILNSSLLRLKLIFIGNRDCQAKNFCPLVNGGVWVHETRVRKNQGCAAHRVSPISHSPFRFLPSWLSDDAVPPGLGTAAAEWGWSVPAEVAPPQLVPEQGDQHVWGGTPRGFCCCRPREVKTALIKVGRDSWCRA